MKVKQITWIFQFIAVAILLIPFKSCKKVENITNPIVLTSEISEITKYSAKCGGNINSDGGASITARGVCWSINKTPTILDKRTSDGIGTGNFISNLSSLTAGTTYNLRAYATNNVGIGYGNIISFTTPEPTVPIIITSPVTLISYTTALSGGTITSDGGSSITTSGVCWSTKPNPTINDENKTIDNNGIGKFSINITGLEPNTTYYIRSYAINSAGVGYGNDLSFLTIAHTISDIDGNVYNTIIIGTQVWMVENLKVTHYRNGEEILYPGADDVKWQYLSVGAYSWYNNDELNKSIYGALYNWHAVSNPAGLCPSGWHVPTNAEWSILIQYLDSDSNPSNFPESKIAGGMLRSARTDPDLHPRWDYPNEGATNESGFCGLPSGARFANGYSQIGSTAHWWSADENGSAGAWDVNISNYSTWVCKSYYLKQGGFSVRCIKD